MRYPSALIAHKSDYVFTGQRHRKDKPNHSLFRAVQRSCRTSTTLTGVSAIESCETEKVPISSASPTAGEPGLRLTLIKSGASVGSSSAASVP